MSGTSANQNKGIPNQSNAKLKIKLAYLRSGQPLLDNMLFHKCILQPVF